MSSADNPAQAAERSGGFCADPLQATQESVLRQRKVPTPVPDANASAQVQEPDESKDKHGEEEVNWGKTPGGTGEYRPYARVGMLIRQSSAFRRHTLSSTRCSPRFTALL